MRTASPAVLIVTLSFLLVGAPAFAAPAATPSAPIGVVVASENSQVGAGVTASGETVYDGDRLESPNGTMRLRLGAEQMILHQGAIAVLHAMPNGFSAVLNNGTVVVSSAAGQTFELAADGAVIRPANAQPASAQITMVSPKELLLTGTRGTLTVTMGDEVKSIEAGNSYRMEVDAGDSGPGPAGQGQSPHPTARNRFLWIFIPAVGVATGIIIWRALVSPSAPGH